MQMYHHRFLGPLYDLRFYTYHHSMGRALIIMSKLINFHRSEWTLTDPTSCKKDLTSDKILFWMKSIHFFQMLGLFQSSLNNYFYLIFSYLRWQPDKSVLKFCCWVKSQLCICEKSSSCQTVVTRIKQSSFIGKSSRSCHEVNNRHVGSEEAGRAGYAPPPDFWPHYI